MKEMRILIQNRRTRLFLRKDGSWVESREDAMEFPTPFTALRFSVDQRLGDTEVVFVPTAHASGTNAFPIPPAPASNKGRQARL